MEIFENIYQKHKTAAHIVIFIISIIAYGACLDTRLDEIQLFITAYRR